jgi:peptidoglycan/xylan/chitin deacetylase (PgdA/CDA1 family)
MSANKLLKLLLSSSFGSEPFYRITNKILNGSKMPYVRALNYHDTPQQFASNFRRQLEWYRSNFVDCNYQQLRSLLVDGLWSSSKPGILISFDDGLKSNYDVAAPLLEEYGFTGWFMIPVAFLNATSAEHREFASKNQISHHGFNLANLAMSWDDVRDLESRGHVITCHSMQHKRLSNLLSDAELHDEIVLAKRALESRLGHPVSGFTWVGGEEWSYSRRAFHFILQANYAEVFCTNSEPIVARQNPLFLERSNIEANFGLNQIRLVLGGLYDQKYKAKRQRIHSLLTA